MTVAHQKTHKQGIQGFSLVELSIVLIILGLLTGGILGGQSLIAAAQLRSIGKEYEQWLMAVNSFKEKYNSLPGDTNLATRLWTGTWDGDGDGVVDDATAAGATGEIFTFWQHLALAGMISGEYTGLAGPGGGGPEYTDSLPAENVPVSKYSGGGWSVGWLPVYGVYTPDLYTMDYGSYFSFGGKIPGYDMADRLLRPEDAWNIDTKFDDGQPAKGNIIARYWDDDCGSADDGGSSTTDLEASYLLSNDSIECALYFRNAF
jgi:prepilin-type N-terminal cleavage/methylation domain-containing protein